MHTKGNILVADDEINLCRILGAKLSKNGYSVVTVHDGQQAIDKVRELDFDVVLLDLILPKVDGLTALAEIRSLKHSLPVIIMTACENSESFEKAMSGGASAFLNKPFDLDNMISLVQKTSHRCPSEDERRHPDSTVLFARMQPVTLDIQNGKCSGQFTSLIEEKNDRWLSVATPKKYGEYVRLSAKTPVRVGLAAKDAYYSFSSHVVTQQADPEVLVLDKPGVIYRTQRRQAPRLSVHTPIRFSSVESDDREGTLCLGMTKDLSVGGIGFFSDKQMTPGQSIYIETDSVGEIGTVTAIGQVLRCNEMSETSSYKFEIGMRFTQANDSIASSMV